MTGGNFAARGGEVSTGGAQIANGGASIAGGGKAGYAGCCAQAGGSGRALSAGAARILNQSCPSSTESNACFRCEDEHCCNTYRACRVDSLECSSITDCMKTCVAADRIDTCLGKCAVTNSPGAQLYLERSGCVGLYCSTQCGSSQSSCDTCGNSQCAIQSAECASDFECTALTYCMSACETDECFAQCNAQHPAGRTLLEGNLQCLEDRCSAECVP